MAAIFHGEKPCLDRNKLSKAYVAQIEGLYMKNLLAFIKERP